MEDYLGACNIEIGNYDQKTGYYTKVGIISVYDAYKGSAEQDLYLCEVVVLRDYLNKVIDHFRIHSKALVCNDCQNSLYGQAFTETTCELCGIEITSPHMPGYKLCRICAEIEWSCQQCGSGENL